MCIEVLYNLYLKYACLLNQFFWLLYTKDDSTTAVMITLVMALSVVLCIPFLICYFELRGIDDKLKKKSSRLQHLGRLLLPVGIFSIPFFVLLVPYLIILFFVISLLKTMLFDNLS
jgi:predicted membrane channel-forming protein YqfA (hemolysin III family)